MQVEVDIQYINLYLHKLIFTTNPAGSMLDCSTNSISLITKTMPTKICLHSLYSISYTVQRMQTNFGRHGFGDQ